MSNFIDNAIALRLLVMLVTPFKETEAFKRGVIDETGKYIIPLNKRTKEQKDTINYLTRLIFNVKKALNKLPGGESKLKNLAAAMFLIREAYNGGKVSTLTEEYVDNVNSIQEERQRFISLWGDYLTMKEEMSTTGAPFNSISSGNVDMGTDVPLGLDKNYEYLGKFSSHELNNHSEPQIAKRHREEEERRTKRKDKHELDKRVHDDVKDDMLVHDEE